MRRAKKGRAEAAAALEIIIKPLIHRSLLQHQPASNIAKLVKEEWKCLIDVFLNDVSGTQEADV